VVRGPGAERTEAGRLSPLKRYGLRGSAPTR